MGQGSPGAGALEARAFSASRQGPGRNRNQDAFLCAPHSGFFLIADGIGGLDHGDRASWGVVHALESRLPMGAAWEERPAIVERLLQEAHADLLNAGRVAQPPYVMGTTVAALLLGEREAAGFWAGDSRLYLLRDGVLTQKSIDHSALGFHEGSRIPRPMLTRAVGVDEVLDVDTCRFPVQPGDILLLCSDGVHGVLSDAAMAGLLGSGAEHPAMQLVEAALAAGGRDDATAIVTRISLRTARPETPALQRLERACREIARGNYADADALFDLTVADDASPTLRQLAESVGFMLVQIEAREMRLTGLIEDLKATQQQLEVANRKLAQENAELAVTVQRLRVDIDRQEFHREVGEIVETEYFQQLQRRAREMRARHGASRGPADT